MGFLAVALLLAGCTMNPGDTAIAPGSGPSSVHATNDPAAAGRLAADPAGNATKTILTMAEVAKHASKSDCWMVIGDQVLDLSSYTTHPGGDTYVPYCGTNATQAYNDKGGRGVPHSGRADAEIAYFVIGQIGRPMIQAPAR
jgi:cytochrome b involved in lipid metabolism